MYTNHRHYVLLILALLAIVVSCIGYVVFYRTITSRSVRAYATIQELAVTDEKKQREASTAALYAKTTLEREYLSRSVLSKEKIVEFIKLLEKIGNDVGVELELSGIAEEPAVAPETLGYFKGHIEARGSWANVMRVLILLEHIPYSVTISNVKLQDGTDEKTPWSLSLDIKVLTTQ